MELAIVKDRADWAFESVKVNSSENKEEIDSLKSQVRKLEAEKMKNEAKIELISEQMEKMREAPPENVEL